MSAIVITKDNSYVCFGQTGEIISFNEFNDQLVFKPHGRESKISMHYSELIDDIDFIDYKKINKAISYIK